MFKQLGFLGTGATFGADLTLIVQTLFYLALLVGIAAQLRRKYKWHDRIQAPVVVLNLFFIFFIMVVSLREAQILSTLPKRPGDPFYLAAGLHAILGTVTEGLAIYCLLAGFKILPRKIGRLKHFMRATYALWTVTFLFGLGTYYVWYLRPVEAVPLGEVEDLANTTDPLDPNAPPPPRRVSLQNFAFAPVDLTVVAGTTVIWVNQDSAPHNVTFVDNSVASDNYFQGEAFEHDFRAVGTFSIYCTLHGNPGNGMAGTVTVVEASEENVTELAAQPVEVNTVPPAPTPAPPVPPAPVSFVEPAEPSDVVAGILTFRDNVAPSDSVILVMNNIAPAGAGMALHAWLTAGDGSIFDIGIVAPDAQGNVFYVYSHPERQNLMALYDGVEVTAEPEPDTDPAPGEALYSGRQAPQAYAAIRQITVSAETPGNYGYGVAARLQTEEVIRHALYLQLAYDLGSLGDAQRHAEHIVNIIEGQSGEFFGDLDGAHGVQNPGDGVGVIPYIFSMKEVALQAFEAGDSTPAIRYHAEHVDVAANNSRQTAQSLREAAVAVTEAGSIGEIGEWVATINTLSQRLLLGEDLNGDGNIALAEGGIFIAYQHAQYMGAIGIIAGADAAIVDPTSVGGVSESAQATGDQVVIDMLDFAYSLPTVTIPAGTAVRFVNVGQAQHSATADDQSFDSGLLGPGEEFTISFEQPGFVPYYCILHGTPGHTGMAGSITVAEPGAEVVIPTPEPAEAPPAASQVSLEMLDFEFSQLEMTIPAGTTVTWFNTGEEKHSATADDASWDTGLLDHGTQASITFDTPGTFAYFCILHGAPGGVGMSATITVVEPSSQNDGGPRVAAAEIRANRSSLPRRGPPS
ncbi:MAG: plastocyanin/azurin family copper-binding protein [Chloroflexi bacterium]|nr:plastocyanin/azurin family copper-binding protein [Chloroflexota bacterium]MCI0577615.1 plastocyanin/azurin family copper-binding protein [Chloroflexota bacterium]MCI0644165.1 plastocyanin/azurin family copper-binding protein [Chloroflexota bacterium]MCI0725252.1 plastocyanin/azurin family copper-binding protein [Chloroflexota bacterium]